MPPNNRGIHFMNYDPDNIPHNELGRANLFRIDATKPAGFWLRVGAVVVDFVVLLPLYVLTLFLPGVFLYLLLSILSMLYKPILEGALGATVGKFALGLRVMDGEGNWVGVPTAVLRNLFFILPAVPGLVIGVRFKEAGLNPLDFNRAEEIAEISEQYQTAGMLSNVLWIVWLVTVLWVAFHPRKRGLHDLLAQTFVVERKK